MLRSWATAACLIALVATISKSEPVQPSLQKGPTISVEHTQLTPPPKPEEDGMKVGDLATWVSGIFTAFLFFFTLHVWREERKRNLELEKANKIERALAEANKVSCWIEKSSLSLRRRTGYDQHGLPDGTWALILENDASFALFNWSAVADIKNPTFKVELNSRDRGPIGPNGGLLVLPIAAISRDAMPRIAVALTFSDDRGAEWTRDGEGLRVQSPPTTST